MRHWARDVLLTRRGLIACAAGLVVAKAVPAGMTPTPAQTAGPFYPRTKPDGGGKKTFRWSDMFPKETKVATSLFKAVEGIARKVGVLPSKSDD